MSLKHPSGADVVLAVDGNFSHRHNAAAGDCPDFGSTPQHFISAKVVRSVRKRLERARRGAARPYHGEVPEEAVRGCGDAHEAGRPERSKTKGSKFDDKGVMVLICRHDTPLFLANIDTPGEGQQYAIALLETAMKHLPASATVFLLYDIACQLSHSSAIVCSMHRVDGQLTYRSVRYHRARYPAAAYAGNDCYACI